MAFRGLTIQQYMRTTATKQAYFLIWDSFMRDILYFVVCALSSIFCIPALGARADHSILLRQMSGKPLTEVVAAARRAIKQGKEEEALALSLFVCGKYDDVEETEENKHACVGAYLCVGNIHYLHGSYSQTLNYYVKGLEICETETKSTEKPALYNNIGSIYSAFKDYEKALSYYLLGYKASCEKGGGDRKDVFNLLTNITTMQALTGHTTEAERYYALSRRYSDKRIPDNVFTENYNLILIKVGKRQFNQAVALCHRLLAYVEHHALPPLYEGYIYEQLYESFDALHEDDSTMVYLRKCQSLAAKNHLQHLFLDSYKMAARIYEQRGNDEMAQKFKAYYLTLMDSVYDQREFDAAKNLQFQYETDKINKEVSAVYARERSHKQTIRFMSVIVVISVAFLIVVTLMYLIVIRQKRRIKENYASLFMVNKRLTANQEAARQQHARDTQLIEEAETNLRRMRQELEDTRGVQPETKTGISSKYTKSRLSSEQMRRLADAILSVMDDTKVYSDADFTLEKLASAVDSNTAYVSQTINTCFHKNFATFVNEYRVQLACRLLADTEHYGHITVKGIGSEVGFKSPSTFMTTFKKITGMTPYVYQQMALNDKREE